jgi:hypothetical protein
MPAKAGIQQTQVLEGGARRRLLDGPVKPGNDILEERKKAP